MSKHIETRRKLKSIVLKSDFEHLLDICIMTEEDKALMRMHESTWNSNRLGMT